MNAGPFFSNPTTSRDAARSVEATLSLMEQKVIEHLIVTGGSTAEMLEEATGFRPSTISARIRGLVLRGKVEDSGLKIKNSRERFMIVWRVVTTAPRQMDLLGV